MGAVTTVYGFVCLAPEGRSHNEGVLASFQFDPVYPFTNIFSHIHDGYGGDVVSFAGRFKSLDEEWDEWEKRFQELLLQLLGRTARVHLEHETDGEVKSVAYVCDVGWDASKQLHERNWTKWNYGPDGRSCDEIPITPKV